MLEHKLPSIKTQINNSTHINGQHESEVDSVILENTTLTATPLSNENSFDLLSIRQIIAGLHEMFKANNIPSPNQEINPQ